MREGEDHVEVADGQDFRLPLGHPAVPGGGLALRAMTIPAGIIRDGLMPALGALVAMTAQGGGAATLDGVQRFDMRPVQPAPVALEETVAPGANDVGHLYGWPVHLFTRRTRPLSAGVEDETDSSSSGLATVLRCRWDSCR